MVQDRTCTTNCLLVDIAEALIRTRSVTLTCNPLDESSTKTKQCSKFKPLMYLIALFVD